MVCVERPALSLGLLRRKLSDCVCAQVDGNPPSLTIRPFSRFRRFRRFRWFRQFRGFRRFRGFGGFRVV
jgi:hypothetical protein